MYYVHLVRGRMPSITSEFRSEGKARDLAGELARKYRVAVTQSMGSTGVILTVDASAHFARGARVRTQ